MNPTAQHTSVWFITGCSSGLGRAIATEVLRQGYRCAVTARDAGALRDLAAPFPDHALPIALDVTDPAQLHRAVRQTEEKFGAIDALVNNAGFGYNAAVEEGEDAQIRALFDTNFFALAAAIRCVLPGMRARGRGHILNISSSGGVVGTVGGGYYSATKFAVEGLSEALAKEVTPLGIRVTLIEPGPFRTDFQGRSIRLPATPIEAYASTAGAQRARLRANSGKQAGDPQRAAAAIIAIYESPNPPLHLALGKIALERIRDKLTDHLRSTQAWESLSLSADFDAPGT